MNGLRTWIEIDKQALRHNYEVFRSLIESHVKFGAVVKSNAYGHDFVQCSLYMEKLGADYILVDSITEALRLRKEGITLPIIVLGYTLPDRLVDALEYDIAVSISSKEALKAVIDVASQKDTHIKIHIKVDTGMNRQGFFLEDKEEVISLLKNHTDLLKVEGVFTHFASAKNPSVFETTRNQIKQFEIWKTAFLATEFNPLFHVCATGGALLYPEAHYDLIRIGVGLYGYWPSLDTKGYCEDRFELRPALTWKTVISEIKDVKSGSTIGYDGTEIARRDTKLAICPIGYWHGFSRRLSCVGHVLVHGQRARVLGRVSMDMIAIDVTEVSDVQVLDEVVVLGVQGNKEVSAYEMAELDETGWYETITRINPLIKRIYR